ncbi:MAG TPA: mechanosensitive ion channel family protein [Mycobacteriales bacterium]|nr:mechanosensitive ion channel family protein [Mycobacteriales bacterium]
MNAEDAVDTGRSFGQFVADNRDAIIVRPLHIIVIILLALGIRWLLFRAINRMVRSTAHSDVPVVLRPLKDRLNNGSAESAVVDERRRQRAETVGSLLRSITSLVIGVLALMLVLGEIGFQLGPFIAGAGIIGVAVAFGAQNVVKDFLSGIFMVLEDQYGVGDVVDLGAASGTVEAVGLRVTRVRDASGTLWYARNGEILRVGNKSKGFALVTLDLPVPYGSDVDAAGATMQMAADELVTEEDFADAVLEEPKLLGVEEIDVEKGVTLRLTVKVRPSDQWRVARALRQRIADRLDQDGIRRAPGNGLDVHTEPVGDANAAAPVDGGGGQPPTGPTSSDPIPREPR